MFYSMYQKYTFFVNLYICGLTYRLYIRYKYKLRIDVITYVPTLANDLPLPVCCCLSTTAIIVGVPVVPGIATSGHQDIRSTAPVRSTSLWWWIPGIPRWICGMGSLLGSAVVGSLLRWVARKNFIAKSPADPSRNPQMMSVAQRGRLKFLKMSFWRII